MLVYAIIFAAIVVLVVYMIKNRKTFEFYGGAVRNVRKVPMNDCYSMCERSYNACRLRYYYDNTGKCERQNNACYGECYYSNSQRM